MAAQQYVAIQDRYPGDVGELVAARELEARDWSDPWGNAYVLAVPDGGIEVICKGADQELGTADDLSSARSEECPAWTTHGSGPSTLLLTLTALGALLALPVFLAAWDRRRTRARVARMKA